MSGSRACALGGTRQDKMESEKMNISLSFLCHIQVEADPDRSTLKMQRNDKVSAFCVERFPNMGIVVRWQHCYLPKINWLLKQSQY